MLSPKPPLSKGRWLGNAQPEGLFILIFNKKHLIQRIEGFYMKIIMRRISGIFYFENTRNGSAIRQCQPNKTKGFY